MSKKSSNPVFDRILKEYRAKNANQLAKVLKEKFDIGRSTVYDWYRGSTTPEREHLLKLARDRGKTPEYFLEGEGGSENSEQNPSSRGEQLIEEMSYHFEHLQEERRPQAENLFEVVIRELKRLGKL